MCKKVDSFHKTLKYWTFFPSELHTPSELFNGKCFVELWIYKSWLAIHKYSFLNPCSWIKRAKIWWICYIHFMKKAKRYQDSYCRQTFKNKEPQFPGFTTILGVLWPYMVVFWLFLFTNTISRLYSK